MVFQSGAALRRGTVAGPPLRRSWSSPSRPRWRPSSTPRNVTVITDEADPERVPAGPGRAVPGRGRHRRRRTPGRLGRPPRHLEGLRRAAGRLSGHPGRPAGRRAGGGRGTVPGKEEYAAWLRQRAAALPGVHWLGPRRTSATSWPTSTCSSRCPPSPSRSGWSSSRPWPRGCRSWPAPPADRSRSSAEAAIDAGVPAGGWSTPGDPAALAAATVALLPPDGVEHRSAGGPASPLRQPAASRASRGPFRDRRGEREPVLRRLKRR